MGGAVIRIILSKHLVEVGYRLLTIDLQVDFFVLIWVCKYFRFSHLQLGGIAYPYLVI